MSTAEHKQYPFYATQWHPEKPVSEFGMAEVPHTLSALRVSQHLANVFIDTARRSSHVPESPEQVRSRWCRRCAAHAGAGPPARPATLPTLPAPGSTAVPPAGPLPIPPTPSLPPPSPPQELNDLIYNWAPYFTLKDSVMDGGYDGPDMT